MFFLNYEKKTLSLSMKVKWITKSEQKVNKK